MNLTPRKAQQPLRATTVVRSEHPKEHTVLGELMQSGATEGALVDTLDNGRRVQLISTLEGIIICRLAGSIWAVPKMCSIWLPGNIPHRLRQSQSAKSTILSFDSNGSMELYGVEIRRNSPMVFELIQRLSSEDLNEINTDHVRLLLKVLTSELALMPVEPFGLRLPESVDLRQITNNLVACPYDRRSLSDWASLLDLHECSISTRFILETGLTFGRWRQRLHLIMGLEKLAEGDSVNSVAKAMGYKSTSGFIDMFKRTAGVSPGRAKTSNVFARD